METIDLIYIALGIGFAAMFLRDKVQGSDKVAESSCAFMLLIVGIAMVHILIVPEISGYLYKELVRPTPPGQSFLTKVLYCAALTIGVFMSSMLSVVLIIYGNRIIRFLKRIRIRINTVQK